MKCSEVEKYDCILITDVYNYLIGSVKCQDTNSYRSNISINLEVAESVVMNKITIISLKT